MEYTSDEYMTQLFGFPSWSVFSGIKESLDGIVEGILASLSQKLTKKMKKDDIEKVNKMFYDSYEKSFKEHTSELKAIVDEFFRIPNNVLLSEDSCQKEQYSEEEARQLAKEVEDAKCYLRALFCLEKKLKLILESILNQDKLVSEVKRFLDVVSDLGENFQDLNSTLTQGFPYIDDLIEQFKKQSVNDATR